MSSKFKVICPSETGFSSLVFGTLVLLDSSLNFPTSLMLQQINFEGFRNRLPLSVLSALGLFKNEGVLLSDTVNHFITGTLRDVLLV